MAIWTEEAEREIGNDQSIPPTERARIIECGRAINVLEQHGGMDYAMSVLGTHGKQLVKHAEANQR